MPAPPRERISGVDTAWLRMDQPTSLMMIVGVMMLDGRADVGAVRKAIAARFLAYRRFGQRAVQDAAGAWWEDVDVDLESHVVATKLGGKGGKRELERLVSTLASTPLDPARPLWQFHVVDGYRGASALVARIHHCYADGIALIQVMLSLTGDSARASLAAPPRKAKGGAPPAPQADLWSRILDPVKSLAADPAAAGAALQGLAGRGMDIAAEAAKLVLMPRDTDTRFRGALGARKAVVWAEPLPLEEVKAIGKALGCSINDVLLSMATGALRDYLLAKGDAVDDSLQVRAIVPVNLRSADEARHLGNYFGLVFLDLPLGIAHPLERLYEVRRRMLALKGSYQPLIALALLSAVGYGPRALQDQVTQLLGANASAVMTNVPGPQHALYFAGRRIAGLEFWVPQSGGIGMGVSILSYDGRIRFGVITDAGLVPDPARIVRAYGEEFDKLMWLTLMSPWTQAASEAGPEAPTADAVSAKAGIQSRIPRRFRNL